MTSHRHSHRHSRRPALSQRILQTLRRGLLPALLGLAGASALAAAPRDRLTLLVPDGADLASWQVKVWIDTAAEEGITLDLLSDSALLAMGPAAASRIAGLIVPDSAHNRASDEVVAAIKQYTFLGGHTMLVYDAGVLTAAGAYPLTGSSRFGDLVGVDYGFWNNGLGAATMVGFGPVVGTKARLESLSLPPGKYLPYVPPASLAMATLNTAFVPTSALDPGGTAVMQDLMKRRARQAIEDGSAGVRKRRPTAFRELMGIGQEGSDMLRFERRNLRASAARDKHMFDKVSRSTGAIDAVLSADGKTAVERSPLSAQALAGDATLQTISGYAYGPLGYFHYVTTGTFPGSVHLSSPEHGLVAGQRAYGSGQLLFVNLPLGYFKAIGTDSAPMHGYLGLFAREQVGVTTVSAQPRGRGGLIYNWHIDDGDDLTVNTKYLLDKTKVLQRGPFSIHLTVGPDVITFGDGNGMDLNNNPKSQELLRNLAGQKKKGKDDKDDKDEKDGKDDKKSKLPDHAIGSHGGWIHDYWGMLANEANVPDLTHLLAWNFDAITNTIKRPIREYSSPTGNTPRWAVQWMEQRGVVAMYLVADLGNGMLRSWRDGSRLSSKLWTSPVTPLGRYATFEEFDEFGISDAQSGQWLLDLQSFVVNRRTNRMFYNHPPGAAAHLTPINALLTRADSLEEQDRFSWYTMTQLADFSQRRIETEWSTSTSGNRVTFTATHPSALTDVTRLLPKRSYALPVVISGSATVSSDSLNWIVTAERGSTLRFITTAL